MNQEQNQQVLIANALNESLERIKGLSVAVDIADRYIARLEAENVRLMQENKQLQQQMTELHQRIAFPTDESKAEND